MGGGVKRVLIHITPLFSEIHPLPGSEIQNIQARPLATRSEARIDDGKGARLI